MKMKRYRRITAGVLAIALLATLPGMDNIKVFAEQKTAEKQGVNELIVSSRSESFDTFGAADCISIGDGLYVLSYANEAEAENAHKNYQQMEGILFADKNIAVTVQTQETISSDAKENESAVTDDTKHGESKQTAEQTQDVQAIENETEQTTPEDEADKKDASIKKKNDTESEDLSSEESVKNEETDKNEISSDSKDNKNSRNEDEAEQKETEQTEKITSNETEIPQEDNLIRVAVIDTGISGNIGNLAPYLTDTGINVSKSGEAGSTLDDNGHGTAMAQVIVSALEENGRNSDSVKLIPIKVLDADGKGTILSAYQGMKAAIEQKADIICLGFSAKGESKLLEQAVNTAYEQGIIVTAPAGNDNEEISAYVPGCYEKAVVVGNAKNKQEADNSNYGDTVDFAAYGTKEVLSLTGETQTVKGTSVSCAYVAGVAASFQKGLTCEEREAGLTQRAVLAENESLKAYFGKGIIGDVSEKEDAKESKTEKADEKTPDKNEDKTGEAQEAAKENVESDKKAEKTNETEYVLPGVLAKPEKLCKKESSIKDEITALDMKTFGDSNAYYTDATIDASGMSAGNGYHWEKDGDPFSCTHNSGDTHSKAWIKSTWRGLKPTKAQLESKDYIEYSNIPTPDDPYLLNESYVIANSANNAAVSIWAQYINIPGLDYLLLTNPYHCETGTPDCGYAGYATWFYNYSICEYTGAYYLTSYGTEYFHCSHSVNPTTNLNFPYTHVHILQKYKKVKNSSTVYYNANEGSIADEVYKNGNSYYKLNSNGTVVYSNEKNGTYDKRKNTISYRQTLNPMDVSSFNITRKGYHLVSGKEWYATIGGKKVYFNQSSAYAASTLFPNIATKTGETITLYANWTPNKSTITYNGNGGTIKNNRYYNVSNKKYYKILSNDTVQESTDNQTWKASKVKKDDVKLNLYYNESQKKFYRLSSGIVQQSTDGLTWETVKKTVTYETDDKGKETADKNGPANVNTFYIKKTGHHKKDNEEWNTDAKGTGTSYNESGQYTPSQYFPNIKTQTGETKTLYVNWEVNTYTIHFDGNGATSGEVKDQPMSYGVADELNENKFLKAGYEFVGWDKDDDGDVDYKDIYPVINLTTKHKDVVTLKAVWKAKFQGTYVGNGQTKGSDFIDTGADGLGYSESINYTFDENKQKSGTESNLSFAYEEQQNTEESYKQAHEHFSKEETITYVDEHTNQKDNTFTQKIEGTVVGWSLGKSDFTYGLNEIVHGERLTEQAKALPEASEAITIGSPASDYGQFQGNNLVTDALHSVRSSQTTAQSMTLGVQDTLDGIQYVNLYAKWDMGPKIEAYDRYYTLDEAQRGFITEDELLNAAKATDEELISESNTEGRLKNYEDTENGTSFEVWDYDADLFKELTGSCMISQRYRAKDEAGNVTEQMINVHIVDGTDTIIDGHDIGVDPDKGEVRFISEKYLHTIAEQNPDSIWVRNEEYKQVLEETVKIKRVNPERSEPVGLLKAFGDKYTIPIAGTGTWTKEPQFVWEFTRAEIDEVKVFIEEHGPSNYVEEDALDKFIAEFLN